MRQCKTIRSVVAIMMLGSNAHAIADYVVLQSESEVYPQGQLIAKDSVIELNEGESLVLMSDGSDIIEIAGPFHGVPAGTSSQDFDLKTALTDLINNPNNVYASLGSTRNMGLNSEANEQRPAWALDPLDSGVQCVRSNSNSRFWRLDNDSELMMVIQRPGIEGSGKIYWAAGESIADWPSDIPIVGNELHVVGRPGWMEKAIIRLVVIPDSIAESVETSIAWMATYGCKKQARLLLPDLLPSR